MVGRLVEYEEIHGVEQQSYHREAAAFAARKEPDVFFACFAAEHERSENVVYLQAYFPPCGAVYRVEDREAVIEELCLVLGIVSYLHVVPHLEFAVKRYLVHDAFHERGLAFAVFPHERHFFTAAYGEVHIREYPVFAVAFAHFLAYQRKIAAAPAWRELEVKR